MEKNYEVLKPLFQNSFIVRTPRAANFADINLDDVY